MPLKRCISDHVVHSRVWTFDYYWTLFCNCKEGKCFVKSICQTQFGISFECLKKCLEVVYDINSLKLIWYDFSRPCFFLLVVWRDQGVDTLQNHCCVSGRFHFNQVMYQFLSECCEILGAWLASKVPNDVHIIGFLTVIKIIPILKLLLFMLSIFESSLTFSQIHYFARELRVHLELLFMVNDYLCAKSSCMSDFLSQKTPNTKLFPLANLLSYY